MGSRSQQQLQQQDEGEKSENNDENWAVSSDKPYFSIIISKSHIFPFFHLVFPAKVSNILPLASTIPVMITNRVRIWAGKCDMEQCGKYPKRLCKNGWKDFAIDTNLKVGDACVFELLENSTKLIKLRVQILRGDLPPGFLNDIGHTPDAPIIIE